MDKTFFHDWLYMFGFDIYELAFRFGKVLFECLKGYNNNVDYVKCFAS